MIPSYVWWDFLNEPQVANPGRGAVADEDERNFCYRQNSFANGGRWANRELSNLAERKRFPVPGVRPDSQVIGIVEGHDQVFRRLRGKPSTDMILGDDALWDVERYVNRSEESIAEKQSAVSAQLVHLVTGVRCVIANILVTPLQGGRQRRRR